MAKRGLWAPSGSALVSTTRRLECDTEALRWLEMDSALISSDFAVDVQRLKLGKVAEDGRGAREKCDNLIAKN